MLYLQTTWIHGYNDLLLTHSHDQLEPYAMLEIFWDIHDAVHKLKNVQMGNGDGDTLLEIARALGATLESATQGGSSIIKAIQVQYMTN